MENVDDRRRCQANISIEVQTMPAHIDTPRTHSHPLGHRGIGRQPSARRPGCQDARLSSFHAKPSHARPWHTIPYHTIPNQTIQCRSWSTHANFNFFHTTALCSVCVPRLPFRSSSAILRPSLQPTNVSKIKSFLIQMKIAIHPISFRYYFNFLKLNFF